MNDANGEMVFYTNPMSRGRIVRWMLEEVGCAYKTELVAYGDAMKAPDYLAINPMGKVPALRHGDMVVTECAAICAYLADVFPERGLAPPPGERGAYYRWLFFVAGPLEAAIVNRSLGVEVAANQERMVGYGTYGAVMAALEQALETNVFIAGDRFTAADVYAGFHIGWGMIAGTVEPCPAFERYWGRVSERPAYQRAHEIDEALTAAP